MKDNDTCPRLALTNAVVPISRLEGKTARRRSFRASFPGPLNVLHARPEQADVWARSDTCVTLDMIGAAFAGAAILQPVSANYRLQTASNHVKGLQQPRGWGSHQEVGFNADNLNGFIVSAACLLAFNNPARHPQKDAQG
ncbi:MAG TPA: hypothetical protein VGT08_04600 [Terracidiphilus sp.]|nr:hypothetical protein [Terracidiphilus sp.]